MFIILIFSALCLCVCVCVCVRARARSTAWISGGTCQFKQFIHMHTVSTLNVGKNVDSLILVGYAGSKPRTHARTRAGSL
jgi:hypothetical protein